MLLCDSLEGWDGGGVEGRFKRVEKEKATHASILAWRILSITLLERDMSVIVW